MSLNKISINDTTTVNTGIVYDISKAHDGATYTDLADALSGNNVLPEVREGGMSIRFVSNSDNNYVQFRYKLEYENTTAGNAAFVNTDNWEVCEDVTLIENPEFIAAFTDLHKKLLAWFKKDGSFDWAVGVQKPVRVYVEALVAEILNGNEGTDIDGLNKVIAFLNDFSTSDTLEVLLNSKVDKVEGKGLIQTEVGETISVIDNPEYIDVEMDSEKNVLGGRKNNGDKFENMPYETPSTYQDSIDDVEGRMEILETSNKTIPSYRDKKGILHEKAGIITNGLILSEEGLEKLKTLINPNGYASNPWKGKSIAWYGTSIPAGGYPYIVGSILDAKIYNYATGSSGASTPGNSYTNWLTNMGHSVTQKIAFVNDCWTIDDKNETFTVGPRQMGVTDIPNYTTYAQVSADRLRCIVASYEIKLTVRTLIENNTRRDAYLQSILGDLYDLLLTKNAKEFEYYKIDCWVFDHGHNDVCNTNPTELDMSATSMNTFVGAMNTYIRLIHRHKGQARIIIVSDYDNFYSDPYNVYPQKYTIETQQAIADKWHLPIIRIDKYLPFNIDTSIRTNGYWDAAGIWHNEGFVWGELDGNKIGNGYFNNYIIKDFGEPSRPSRTVEELETILQPVQEADGRWFYSIPPRYLWIFDGIHPHTSFGGFCLIMYAECLSGLLRNISANGK